MADLQLAILNLGSTSFKCKFFRMGREETTFLTAGVETIGGMGRYTLSAEGVGEEGDCACPTHLAALQLCLDVLSRHGMPLDLNELDAIGYKAVHGGNLSGARLVDPPLIAEMERMTAFAPAHNPVYLSMMEAVALRYPRVTQIACFETAFHATVPLARAVYGVPYEWMAQYGVRRYGFHGSSHSYIAWKLSQVQPGARRVLSAHLGGSSSLCAILDGASIACSMGATPQSGLFHNNRVGDLDVFVLPTLADQLGGLPNVMQALSAQSGFLGLSGVSNDLRQVEAAAAAGNERAALAIAAFEDAIVGYIGMGAAYLGGLDALVFTGGIGLNAAALRARVVARLDWLGMALDAEKNLPRYEGKISTDTSRIAVWSLNTDEELMVARGCVRLLHG